MEKILYQHAKVLYIVESCRGLQINKDSDHTQGITTIKSQQINLIILKTITDEIWPIQIF